MSMVIYGRRRFDFWLAFIAIWFVAALVGSRRAPAIADPRALRLARRLIAFGLRRLIASRQ
jgi:hypothetical protein